MYGLLVESIVDYTKKRFGNGIWEKVRAKAKLDNYTFSTHQQYSETLFLRLVKCLADVTNTNLNEILEDMGMEFIGFVSQYGYDRILKVLGRHMRDFLNGLDNLHEYMRFSYPKLKPPSFFVEKESADGLILHYRSKRKGYLYYVKGQLKQVGKIFYNIDVDITIVSETLEGDMTSAVFDLRFKNDQYKFASGVFSSTNLKSSDTNQKSKDFDLPVKSEIFFDLFPFHVVFNKNLDIISIGHGLAQAMKHVVGESIKDLFNLVRPLVPFTWDHILSHTNNVFEMSTIEPIRRSASPTNDDRENSIYGTQLSHDSSHDECLKLKGQMMYIKEWDSIIFLATPVLENLDNMFTTGFYINDLSMHDSSRDLVLVGTQQSAELKLALDQEKQKSKALEDSMKKLDIEMKRTDQLLYQMIPKKIADRLRGGEPAMNLCEVVPMCTILFSDVVGFTQTCSQLNPMEVVSMLNSMYTKFDKTLESHNVYKVETIGDAYMIVSGLPEKTNSHATEIIDMAFDMLANISTLINPATKEPMKIRVGCHSGSVVAGVVGLKMPRYCLFGDTVNTANRMESTSEAMKIHISETTKSHLQEKKYKIVERGKIEVKGKGEMKTYFVLAKRDEDGRSIKCPFMEAYEEGKKAQSVNSNSNTNTKLSTNTNTSTITNNNTSASTSNNTSSNKSNLNSNISTNPNTNLSTNIKPTTSINQTANTSPNLSSTNPSTISNQKPQPKADNHSSNTSHLKPTPVAAPVSESVSSRKSYVNLRAESEEAPLPKLDPTRNISNSSVSLRSSGLGAINSLAEINHSDNILKSNNSAFKPIVPAEPPSKREQSNEERSESSNSISNSNDNGSSNKSNQFFKRSIFKSVTCDIL